MLNVESPNSTFAINRGLRPQYSPSISRVYPISSRLRLSRLPISSLVFHPFTHLLCLPFGKAGNLRQLWNIYLPSSEAWAWRYPHERPYCWCAAGFPDEKADFGTGWWKKGGLSAKAISTSIISGWTCDKLSTIGRTIRQRLSHLPIWAVQTAYPPYLLIAACETSTSLATSYCV